MTSPSSTPYARDSSTTGTFPPEDINQAREFTSRGYTIDKWTDFGFNDFFLNFTNPQVGPIFKQLYVRKRCST